MNARECRLVSAPSTMNKAALELHFGKRRTPWQSEIENPDLGTSRRDLHLGMAVAFGYHRENRGPGEMGTKLTVDRLALLIQ